MTYGSCNVCGSKQFRRIKAYPGFEGIDVVICERCELIQAQPIPTEEFLDAYYKKEFGFDPQQGFDMPPESEKGFRLRATLQFHYVDSWIRPGDGAGKKILDVGCHAASFLSLFKKRGWDVTGIDPNPRSRYAEEWYGIRVRQELFRHGTFEPGTFDAILHSHVLEHVRLPREHLTEFCRVLKPGGWAFIEVPNESEASVTKFDDYNPHLYFFTPQTLRRLAESAGFEVVTTNVLGVKPLTAPLFSKAGLKWLSTRSQACYDPKGRFNPLTALPFFGRLLKQDRYFKDGHPEACMLRVILRKPLKASGATKETETAFAKRA